MIHPIPPEQIHAAEDQSRDERGRFASGGGGGRPSGGVKDARGGVQKHDAPASPKVQAHDRVAAYYGVQSHEPISRARMAPRFTGRGQVGLGPTKLNVLGKARGQAIFRKAGAAKGFK